MVFLQRLSLFACDVFSFFKHKSGKTGKKWQLGDSNRTPSCANTPAYRNSFLIFLARHQNSFGHFIILLAFVLDLLVASKRGREMLSPGLDMKLGSIFFYIILPCQQYQLYLLKRYQQGSERLSSRTLFKQLSFINMVVPCQQHDSVLIFSRIPNRLPTVAAAKK